MEIRPRVMTVLFKASRGWEQYQSMKSRIACSYDRCELGEVRLFRTADLDCSRSRSRRTVFGCAYVCFCPYPKFLDNRWEAGVCSSGACCGVFMKSNPPSYAGVTCIRERTRLMGPLRGFHLTANLKLRHNSLLFCELCLWQPRLRFALVGVPRQQYTQT